MILVCSGPDTYSARQKAKELVEAFRKKHDPSGMATDIVVGELGTAELVSRIGTPSLFATKRMVRADGCLGRMKAADLKTLSEKLSQLGDQIVFLTVEDEPPTAKTLGLFEKAPLHHYPFALMTGEKFRTWVRSMGAAEGVSPEKADNIAEMCDGDTWCAISELSKAAVNVDVITGREKADASLNIFELAEVAMLKRPMWRSVLEKQGDGGFLSIFIGQLRSFLRIRDNAADGIHPFVQKKMSRLTVRDADERFSRALGSHVASRSGLATDEEVRARY